VNSDSSVRNLTVSTGTGAISFSGVVGGNNALGAMSLNSSGVTTLGAAVSAASLTTDAGGSTAINGGAITTTGSQTYNDAVTLGANTSLKSGSGAITFNSSVSGAAFNLSLQDGTSASTGAVTFNGNLSLNSLTTFGSLANYAVSLLGSSNTITSATIFNNTNGVTLGNGGTF